MDLRLDGRVALRPWPREGRQVDRVEVRILASPRHRPEPPPLGLLRGDVGGVDGLPHLHRDGFVGRVQLLHRHGSAKLVR